MNRSFDRLEEGGQTALGPALVLAVSMACQAAGSKVIICTDGKANQGLGNLDIEKNDEYEQKYEEVVKFYDDVTDMATESG